VLESEGEAVHDCMSRLKWVVCAILGCVPLGFRILFSLGFSNILLLIMKNNHT
jgi:hypothetical protein